MAPRIRLYVDHPLGAGQTVPLDRDQSHYLFGVMRQDVGATLLLFNGKDGEWAARISQKGKRAGEMTCETQTKPLSLPPDVWLVFAPVKKARTDFIVEKAVEMGASKIVPVLTDYTNSERFRTDKQTAHAIEAAEQCGATWVPDVTSPEKFSPMIANWDASRAILFCDETAVGQAATLPETITSDTPVAIFIGPEGGFSANERDQLRAMPNAQAMSLGPRILRAETAAIAALALWQQRYGDWQ